MKRRYLIAVLLGVLISTGNAQVFWQADFGPWGGRVNDLCEDPEGNLYAATMQGLVFSDNEGASWRLLALEGEDLRAVHYTQQGTLLVATRNKLLRSTDLGIQWTYISPIYDFVPRPGRKILGFFQHSSGALFFSNELLFTLSMDDGQTWERFGFSDHQEMDRWSEAENGLLMDGYHQYILPDQKGQHTTELTVEGETVHVECVIATGNRCRIAWKSSLGWLFSSDAGVSWTVTSPSTRPEELHMVGVSDNGTVLARLRDRGILFSTDHGETWHDAPALPREHGQVNDLLCTGRGAMFIATNEPGVLRLDPSSGQWDSRVQQMPLHVIPVLLPLKEGEVLSALLSPQEMRRFTPPRTWTTLGNFTMPIADIERGAADALIAATRGGGIMRSTDGGLTWTASAGGEPSVNKLLRRRDGRLLAGGQTALHESADDGLNWTLMQSSDTASLECLLERASGEIVVGGEAGVHIGSSDLQFWHTSYFSWMPVTALAEDGAGRIFAGTLEDGLYRSTDEGYSWEQVGLEGQWVTGIVAAGSTHCFAATRRQGVFESADGGGNWHPYSEGLRSYEILDLAGGDDGFLYVGTTEGIARSVYRVLRAEYLTPDFHLYQNNPNPAAAGTVFAWSIPRAGHVRMSLYDMLGRELAVLFDAPADPGMHWLPVDTRTLVPGTYFFLLRYEGQMQDRKFQVVR